MRDAREAGDEHPARRRLEGRFGPDASTPRGASRRLEPRIRPLRRLPDSCMIQEPACPTVLPSRVTDPERKEPLSGDV